MSDRAARRIGEILASEDGPVMLRVSVQGGGCSGFQYGFTFDDQRQDDRQHQGELDRADTALIQPGRRGRWPDPMESSDGLLV